MIGRSGWPFRIIIVEESVEVRGLIKHVLEDSVDIAVVGESPSGPSALELVHLLTPDVLVVGPTPDRDQVVSSLAALSAERPSLIVITVRLAQTTDDQLAFVKAGAWTLLDHSEIDRLPSAIRRADHIQQELRSIGSGGR